MRVLQKVYYIDHHDDHGKTSLIMPVVFKGFVINKVWKR